MVVPPLPGRERKRARNSLNQTDRTSEILSFEVRGKSKRVFRVFILVFLISIFIVLLLISSSFVVDANPVSVPYSLHSELIADYSVDNQKIILPAARLGLIVDYLRDLGTPDPQSQFIVIQQGLNTLVPTVTPYLILTATLLGQTDMATPTSSISKPAPTNTPQISNNNPTLIVPPLVTLTITPTSTTIGVGRTQTPPYSNTLTPTSIKPPSTKPPNTPSNPTQPTRTMLPATSTPSAPTDTQVPPSPTKSAPTATSYAPSPTKPPPTATIPAPTPTRPPPTATKPPPTPTKPPVTPYP